MASPVPRVVVAQWRPDEQLVPAVLSGTRYTMSALSMPDRCWAVAGCAAAGLTAEEIAGRLHCSLRLVRAIKAEPMTRLAMLMQTETAAFTDELRLVRGELARANVERERLAAERDAARRAAARLAGGPPTCWRGHEMTGYNVYRHPATGRTSCRECRRLSAQDRRRSRKCRVPVTTPAHPVEGEQPARRGGNGRRAVLIGVPGG